MEKIAPGIYISPDAWEDRLYSIQLRNRKIVFESSYKVLGHPVPLYVYFTPVVSESGAIVLHVLSFQLEP